MQYESERIEYKSRMIDDIYKEVIAFANTDGGVIYLGIDDKGNLVGIDNVDETYTRLTNGIRDAIAPDVTMFVRYVLQDNKVIRIEIGEGSYKPYYLKSKGMKPTGVYVRQGASSVQASPEQIRQMIKNRTEIPTKYVYSAFLYSHMAICYNVKMERSDAHESEVISSLHGNCRKYCALDKTRQR